MVLKITLLLSLLSPISSFASRDDVFKGLSREDACYLALKTKQSRPKDQQLRYSQIAKDLSEVTAKPLRFSLGQVEDPSQWRTIPVYSDFALAESNMLTMEPIEQQGKVDLEIQTARDYARFLSRRGTKSFVYIQEFQGRSVPVFDGVIIDGETGVPEVSVSLKYASVKMKKMEVELLLESMAGRLDYDWEFISMDHPAEWLRQFSGKISGRKKLSRRKKINGIQDRKYFYQKYLVATGILIKIFGLFQNGEEDVFTRQEIRTVLDVREHGYSFEFVKKPEVVEGILSLVKSKEHQNQSLTLLWDDHRVIEFTPQGAKIYE